MPSRKIKNDDSSFEVQSCSEESAAGNYSVISYKVKRCRFRIE
jgi:hypothetical protein